MRELPVIFQDVMVNAILEDRKKETRRIIKKVNPDWFYDGQRFWTSQKGSLIPNPHGEPGDILWVRECHRWADRLVDGFERDTPYYVQYRSNGKVLQYNFENMSTPYHMWEPKWAKGWSSDRKYGNWRPSIFMPRWACRLLLRVTDVKVERIQDITKKGAIAEGVYWSEAYPEGYTIYGPHDFRCCAPSAVLTFRRLWNQIHERPRPVIKKKKLLHYVSYPWNEVFSTREYRGKSWIVNGNPWVFVTSFEVVKYG